MSLDEELQREAAELAGYDLDAPPIPESGRDLLTLSQPPVLPPELPDGASLRRRGESAPSNSVPADGEDLASHVTFDEEDDAVEEVGASPDAVIDEPRPARPREVSIEATSPLTAALVKRPVALLALLVGVTLLVALGLVALVLGA